MFQAGGIAYTSAVPLARLSLTDFRSYADLLIEPGPGLVILTGENGAGKTNILEAVSLLAPGRGLRGAVLADMARNAGQGGFGVAAQFGDIALGTGTLAATPDRRLVRINSAPAAANSLSEWLSVLWLTPAMDRLFIEGAAGRRRFLDRLTLALHPAHASHAARYDAAMRARNKLLGEDGPPDPAWLDALEARMAEHGAEIDRARADMLAFLSKRLAAAPESPFARPLVTIEGGEGTSTSALRDSRPRDAAAGRTLAGPHRADLAVTHAGKNQPAEHSSTGEQKALLLSIVLAHADLVRERTGRPLILLLDEVAAHLDPSRRAALFERLAAGGGQVWMTGTEPALFEAAGSAADRYRVAGGRIESA